MFIVFAWKENGSLGGINDMLDSFESLTEAENFCNKLENSGQGFEYQIVDQHLEIIDQNGSIDSSNPFYSCEKLVTH